eukprot:CAMPEP_0119360482 /NCGR_PEP_ID=MMETSP1334-20130426/8069_1 /TAXON_ID=127549 /ORGANISM="Calcidiscus leptoporus, Strain RCC1130" /LENGTH=112 /DNA_ID=CAMNT_0007375327 /DNA_START=13 /DNA_END=347 /DNA_ORIENTATION=+
MHSMAFSGSASEIRAHLLRHPADLHLLDRTGDTLMHIAIRRGDLPLVRVLLDAGFDVNTRNVSGWTVVEEAQAAIELEASVQPPVEAPTTADARVASTGEGGDATSSTARVP